MYRLDNLKLKVEKNSVLVLDTCLFDIILKMENMSANEGILIKTMKMVCTLIDKVNTAKKEKAGHILLDQREYVFLKLFLEHKMFWKVIDHKIIEFINTINNLKPEQGEIGVPTKKDEVVETKSEEKKA